MKRAISCAAMGFVAALSMGAAAMAAPVPDGIGDPRLNGFWNIDEAARREAQAGARAELTPAGEAIVVANRERAAARIARGETVALAAFTCGLLGVPFIIGTSEPWLLVVTKDEVVQAGERYLLTPRHIYTDGRSLPDLRTMPPSSSGYSVGRWEGKELVSTTRGLPSGGIQGGGLKGPQTTLTERVSVDDTGDRLTWTYTWEDPQLLAKPLTYSIKYDRAPPHTYALTQYCDPNDDPGKVVEPPAQEQGAPR